MICKGCQKKIIEHPRCSCCNQPIREKWGTPSLDWYKNEISKILKLKPKGKSINGQLYWHTWMKSWYVEVYEKIKKEK